jgi:hypothetical protein
MLIVLLAGAGLFAVAGLAYALWTRGDQTVEDYVTARGKSVVSGSIQSRSQSGGPYTT